LALNFGEIAVVSMFNAAQWAGMRICFSGVQVKFTHLNVQIRIAKLM